MEHVTDISVPVNGSQVQYRVLFHDELYTFEPEGGNAASFSLRRDHNSWEAVDAPDEATGKQAIAALEKFLLSQH